MPWYKISAQHGGGHQGYTYFYRWFDRRMSKYEKESLWEDLFRNTNNAIGNVEQVKTVPEYMVKRIRENCLSTIKHRKKLLKVLDKTKVIPIDPEDDKRRKGHIRMYKKMKMEVPPYLLDKTDVRNGHLGR